MIILYIYLGIVIVLNLVLFILSFRYDNILANKNIYDDFFDEKEKEKFFSGKRCCFLLYAFIAAAVWIIPNFRQSEYILIAIYIVLGFKLYLNKKYLGRWRERK